jgi:hypothetical protein
MTSRIMSEASKKIHAEVERIETAHFTNESDEIVTFFDKVLEDS